MHTNVSTCPANAHSNSEALIQLSRKPTPQKHRATPRSLCHLQPPPAPGPLFLRRIASGRSAGFSVFVLVRNPCGSCPKNDARAHCKRPTIAASASPASLAMSNSFATSGSVRPPTRFVCKTLVALRPKSSSCVRSISKTCANNNTNPFTLRIQIPQLSNAPVLGWYTPPGLAALLMAATPSPGGHPRHWASARGESATRRSAKRRARRCRGGA